MNAIDMIYNAVYGRCKKEGCDEVTSKNAATSACGDFKKKQIQYPVKIN